MERSNTVNMLSIDVEDYFHVSAFEQISPPSSWAQFESRVERNTDRILDILSNAEVRATFFILGWVARFSPDLVKRIASMGHEIASHGYGHQRIPNMSRQEFREDIRLSKKLLEDLTGHAVKGYRAPSYSIGLDTLWVFDELVDAGYIYDSSVFPIKHDFYGISDWPCCPFPLQKSDAEGWLPGCEMDESCELLEVPISTFNRAGQNLPIAGGGYFRLYPYVLTRMGLQRINAQDNNPFIFYIHPWEFDPGQPRMVNAGLKSRFRHYLNLGKTEARFIQLLNDFSFSTIDTVLGDRIPKQEEPPHYLRPVKSYEMH